MATALHSFCSRRRPCAGSALLMFSFVRRAAVEQAYQQSKDTPGLLRHLPRRLSARYLWKAHSTLSEPSDGSGSWVTFHQAPSPQSFQVPAAAAALLLVHDLGAGRGDEQLLSRDSGRRVHRAGHLPSRVPGQDGAVVCAVRIQHAVHRAGSGVWRRADGVPDAVRVGIRNRLWALSQLRMTSVQRGQWSVSFAASVSRTNCCARKEANGRHASLLHLPSSPEDHVGPRILDKHTAAH